MKQNTWIKFSNQYVDDEGYLHIDAWKSKNTNEEGKTIALISPKNEVKYLDERVKSDIKALEFINSTVNARLNEMCCQIIDIFEEFLDCKNIKIANPEKDDDENDQENVANIYGSDYYELEDKIKEILK